MKLSLSIVFASILFFLVKSTTSANTSVIVENNQSGANNSVNINQNSEFNSNTSNSINSQTHVTITTNGDTKTFETNGDESINWKSDDGKSQVSINNRSVRGVTTITPTPTPSSTLTGTPIPSPTRKPASITQSKSTFFTDFFAKYFSWISNIFNHS